MVTDWAAMLIVTCIYEVLSMFMVGSIVVLLGMGMVIMTMTFTVMLIIMSWAVVVFVMLVSLEM